MTKKLSILGSTGSIGTQALKVCKEQNIAVETLAAGSNISLLEKQAREFLPRSVVIADTSKLAALKNALADTDISVYGSEEAIAELAYTDTADTILNAIVGIAGLRPTMSAIAAQKTLALANKESLVTGGTLVMNAAKEAGVQILPVDSEHSAIFQCLNGENWDKIERVLLTASGGPFFGYTTEQLRAVTKAQALKHPNWVMGAKITIDSSTLMNKGLELIEAMHLFGLRPEQVEIVVHRESILHSAVEFVDKSVIAQLGTPDMCLPIQYALTYPERCYRGTERLSLFDVEKMTFYPPDTARFTCLDTAITAAKIGGLAPAIVNGANEMAVKLFLEDKISYYSIFEAVGGVLSAVGSKDIYTIEEVFEADLLAREYVQRVFL